MVQCGIDMVEIARIRKSLCNPRFLTRVFSACEMELFERNRYRPETIAANFAAKEAFSKAIGTGVRGFWLSEVAVLRGEAGCPYFKFYGAARHIVEQNNQKFSVSLTHTREYAAAVVVAFTDDIAGTWGASGP